MGPKLIHAVDFNVSVFAVERGQYTAVVEARIDLTKAVW